MDKLFLIHPGVTVAEVLEDRGITLDKLSYMFCDKHPESHPAEVREYFKKIINCKIGITPRMATFLQEVVGVPYSFWMNLQNNYDARLKEWTKNDG